MYYSLTLPLSVEIGQTLFTYKKRLSLSGRVDQILIERWETKYDIGQKQGEKFVISDSYRKSRAEQLKKPGVHRLNTHTVPCHEINFHGRGKEAYFRFLPFHTISFAKVYV